MISAESKKEFTRIYNKLFEKELADCDCLEIANRLLELYKIIYTPAIISTLVSEEETK